MAKLVVLTEGLTGTVHELKGERTTVGRLEDNLFQIAESSVSSHHCELVLKGEEILVKDLGSTNGTFINDKPVTEGTLKPGEILRLGKVELRIDDGSPPPPAGTPPPPSKKQQAQQTMPIGGVKLGELDKAGKPVLTSTFAKKSDKTNKLFLYGGLALGVVIIALIVYSIIGVQN
jgi:predicted component of type VI protein secretion system